MHNTLSEEQLFIQTLIQSIMAYRVANYWYMIIYRSNPQDFIFFLLKKAIKEE